MLRSYRCEECNKVLEGIHPTFKQVPPKALVFSTHKTLNPSWEALIAATYPPGPPPITIKSNSFYHS